MNKIKITKINKNLILQRKRFIQQGSIFTKHLQKIVCTSTLSVPILDQDNRIVYKNFQLLGTIDHTQDHLLEDTTLLLLKKLQIILGFTVMMQRL